MLLVAAGFNHWKKKMIREELIQTCTYELVDEIPFVWLQVPPYYDNSYARFRNMLVFTKILRRDRFFRNLPQPDIIVGSSPHPFAAWAAEKLASSFDIPFVFEIRDFWPQSLVDLGKISEHHPVILVMSYLEHYLYAKASKVITLLPGGEQYISKRGINADKISWIPNGIDMRMIPKPIEPKIGGEFNVVYAGAHGLANNLDTVLDCACILKLKGYGHIFFHLIGDGPEKTRLKRRAQDMNLSNVIFEDPVPKECIYDILSQADACIMILQDSPLFKWGISPNKLFDYMAMARPVIFGVNTLFNPVATSGCGFSVSPTQPQAYAEAIIRLSEMPIKERYDMGLLGRQYVEENHDFKELTGRYELVLQEAISTYVPG